MSIETLLTVTAPGHDRADVDLASSLCGETDAHLAVLMLGICVRMPLEVSVTAIDPYIQLQEQELANIEEKRKALASYLFGRSIPSDVTSDYRDVGYADEIIGRRARYADLTVIGPRLLMDEDYKAVTIKGALYGSPTPLLLVPPGTKATLKPDRVMIAWDAGLSAARAVHTSLDILKGAREVSVVLVDPLIDDDHHGDEPGADLATYLARHGVTVHVIRTPSSGREVSEVLQSQAQDCCADLVVMGGYGHSRLREWIFGGTTRSMLEGASVPVLMAH